MMYWIPIGIGKYPPLYLTVLLYDFENGRYFFGYSKGIYKETLKDDAEDDTDPDSYYSELIGRKWVDSISEKEIEPTHFCLLEEPDTVAIHSFTS